MYIDFGPARRFNYLITRYPDLAELRAMLEGWSAKHSWSGRHFLMTVSKEKGSTKFSLDLRQHDVSIKFTETEWDALRELFLKGLAVPEIQRWLEELRLEYGEQGRLRESVSEPRFAEERCLRHRELDGHVTPFRVLFGDQGCYTGTSWKC
jgi:hypothetical protein